MTGFPIVDAAQRQANIMGWMHNRPRMICASFLVGESGGTVCAQLILTFSHFR